MESAIDPEAGICAVHFGCSFKRGPNLDQRSSSNAWTHTSGSVPLATARHQLGPEREETALRRFVGMKGAPTRNEKMALAATRFSQSQKVARAVNVALLKRGGADTQMSGRALKIGFSEIDEPFHFAAAGTAGNTCEPKSVTDNTVAGALGIGAGSWHVSFSGA
jgi:hypothetical protein